MSTKFIKVERSFYISRVPQKVGDVIEVGAAFAKELVEAKKASFVAEAPKPEPEKPQEPKAKAAAPTPESKAATPQKGEK